MTPVLQFGDTATGANGSITGAELTANVTPSILKFKKDKNAPEGERPPGVNWPITYKLIADIANGNTVYNLNFIDVLPADLDYVANSISITGGAGCNPTISVGPPISINVACTSAVGTLSDSDLVVTYQAYVKDVLDESACVSLPITNAASLEADRKDGLTDVAIGILTSEATVNSSHVKIQKTVSPGIDPNFASPGEILTYTVNIQTSDFGSVNNLIFNDLLPDGLDTFAHVSLTNGVTPVAIVPTVASNGDGTSALIYDIGAITGVIAGGSSLQLIYTAKIRQNYQSPISPVQANDYLTNSASISYDLAAGATNCSDSSSVTATIAPLQLTKKIISPQAEYQPGQVVTFRLSMEIPSGDTSGISFEDFFPLPIFDVNTLNLIFGSDIRLALTDTLGLTPSSISVDPATNSLTIDWPDVSTAGPQTLAVDIDITVSSEPFADNLSLTNLFQARTNNTPDPLAPIVDLGLVGIKVGSPSLVITKGIASTSNANSTIDPAPAPPNDSNLIGADAHDEVTYEITVENIGGAKAYDIKISDDLGIPASLLENCVVDSVTDGDGSNNLPFITAATFDGIINLTNPLDENDETPPGGGAPFTTDTAIVKITCDIAQAVEPGTVITNNSEVIWASGATKPTFPAVEDDATVTIQEPDITKSLVGGPTFTIGQIIRYEIEITVPELTVGNVILHDNLDPGLAYVNLTNPANFSIISSAGVTTTSNVFIVNNSGSDLTLNLGTVTNSNTDNTVTETITVAYDVVVLNEAFNDAGDTRANAANITSTSYNSSTINASSLTIVEPNIIVDKTVITAGPYDAGDTVTYQLHVQQTGSNLSDAFDVVLTDVLPANVTYIDTPQSLVAIGACSNLSLDDSNASILKATWSSFGIAQNCIIQYQVTLDTTVEAGTDLNNQVDIAWTSLSGTVAGPISIYNNNSCERTSASDPNACGAGNDYDDNDIATITISEVVIKKKLTSTSEATTTKAEDRTGTNDLAIGETATFTLTITVPEGTSQEIVVTDNLPAHANGVMEFVSVDSVTVGGSLTTANNPAGTAIDARLGDSILDRVIWDFGQVVNNATDGADPSADNAERIIIVLTARMADVMPNNVTGKRTRNRSSVSFGPSLTDTSNAGIDIVEPKLKIDKSSATTTADGGDTVAFTILVDHLSGIGSTQEAFDLVITDAIPTGLIYNTGSLDVTACLGSTTTQNNATGFIVTLDSLPQADSCEITYTADVETTVNPSQVIDNVADVTWDSLPADNAPNERDYSANESHVITISSPGLSKVVFATSEGTTGTTINGPETDLTIGETVTYRFTVTIPEGETDNVVVSDTLPTAGVVFKVVSSKIVSKDTPITLGAHAVNSAGDDCLPALCDTNSDTYRDKVLWNLGNIINTPDGDNTNNEIVFEVVAVVMDVAVNTGGIDNDVLNTASLSHDNDGGSPITGSVAVDLVEPNLELTKKATPTVSPFFADAGDIITFEIEVKHKQTAPASTADAFNIHLEDTLANNGTVALMEWNGDANVGGTCVGTVTNSTATAATPFKVTFDVPTLSLTDSSCTITYEVKVSTLAQPAETLQNQADLQYDSTPFYVVGETRRSTKTVMAEVIINAPSLVKVVSSTSLGDTATNQHDATLNDLTIGEQVTYTITMKFPEGTSNNVVLTDVMPTGLGGVIEVLGASPVVFSLGGNVTSDIPVVTVNAAKDGFNIVFGKVVNSPDNIDNADDLITVTVTGVVVDVLANEDAKQPVNTATFSYTGGTDLIDTATVDIVEPDMSIDKSMTVTNGLATITIDLSNNGTASAYDIQIEDVLDSSNWDTNNIILTPLTGFTLTTVGPVGTETTVLIESDSGSAYPTNTIDPGETVSFQFTVPVKPSISSIDNTATNTVATTLPGTDPNERDETDVADTETLGIPLIELEKTAAAFADTNLDLEVGGVGDIITYNFKVTNTGGVSLSNILIDDALTGSVNLVVVPTTLAPGDVGTAQATYTITQADMNLGTIENQASVTADGPVGAGSTGDDSDDPSDNTDNDNNSDGDPDDPTIVTLPRNPLFNMEKTSSPASLSAPGTITYTFEFTNTGNVGLTNLKVTDPDINQASLTCNGDIDTDKDIDSLAMGVSETCTATRTITQAQIDAGAAITNTATATATDLDGATPVTENPTPNDNSTSTPITQTPKYNMVKTASPASLSAPGILTYTFTFTNTGNVTLSNLTVVDADIDSGTLSCNIDGDNDKDIDTLALLATETCSATRTITQTQIDAGVAITNTATPSATAPDGTTSAVEDDATDNSTSTPITQTPKYNMVKTASPASLSAPGSITYTFTFTNTGNVTLSNLTVVDADIDSGTLSCNIDGDNDKDIDTLALLATETCSATRTITQTQIDAGVAITNTATPSATAPDGTTPAVEDDATDNSTSTPITQTPKYNMVKTASPASLSAPGILTYTFTFTNTGNVTLSNLTVVDADIDSGTLSCNIDGDNDKDIDTLALLATETCSATRTITQTQIDAGVAITNTATPSATEPDGTTVVAEDDATDNTATVPVLLLPKVTLDKSASAPTIINGSNTTIVDPGDIITYTLTIMNSGNVTLHDVVVTDPLIAVLAANCAATSEGDTFINDGTDTLDVGESVTCTVDYVLLQSDIDLGGRDNTATVDALDPSDNPVTNTSTVVSPLVQKTSISLLKTAGIPTIINGLDNAVVDAGDTVSYTFDVKNTGNVTLSNVTVTDLSLGVSPFNMLVDCGAGTNNVASLVASEVIQCTGIYTLTQDDIDGINAPTITNSAGVVELANTASVTGTPPVGSGLNAPSAQSSSIANAQLNAAIELIKSVGAVVDNDSDGLESVGDEITYSYIVKNTGVTTLKDVTIDEDATAFSGNIVPLPVNETSSNISGLSTDASNNGTWDSLAPGDTVVFTAVYILTQNDVDTGSISNTAKASGTPPIGLTPPEAESSVVKTLIAAPSLTITKSADDNSNVVVGQIITYSYEVTNTGNITIDNISVSDVHSGTGIISGATGGLTTLVPGASTIFTATYTITQEDVDAGDDITNVATANGVPKRGSLTAPTDNETVDLVDQAPAMVLTKVMSSNADEDSTGTITLNDTLHYTITALNTGNVTLTNVLVVDNIISPSSITCVSVEPGDSCVLAGVYSVTEIDVAANKIDNTASVTTGNLTNITEASTSSPISSQRSMSLIKEMTSYFDADDSESITEGDILTYTIIARNTGTATITNLKIDDPLINPSTITCGIVVSQATCELVGQYTVTQDDAENGERDNVASAESDNISIQTANISVNVVIPVKSIPTLSEWMMLLLSLILLVIGQQEHLRRSLKNTPS